MDKLYLFSLVIAPIFVSVMKKKRPVKILNVIVATIAFSSLAGSNSLQAQQLYPGDVSNNGIVNNVDVLLWSHARGKTGPARTAAGTEWSPVDLPEELWEDSFPGIGTNYAYADCNGDGVVDANDLNVIRSNYWLTQPSGVTPDAFGSSGSVSQQLILDALDAEVSEGGEIKQMKLGLGYLPDPIPELYGTAFTMVYDPDFIDEIGATNESDISFQFGTDDPNSDWFAGPNGSQAEQFIWSNDQLGIAEVVLYQSEPETAVADFGEIGEFSIVVEEVIFGIEADQNIDLNAIYNVDKNLLTTGPVDGQGTDFYIAKPITTSADGQSLSEGAIRLYPNPISDGWITAEISGSEASTITRLEVIDLNGRAVRSVELSGEQGKINLQGLPQSAYILRVSTDAGFYRQQIIKGHQR